MRLSYVLLLLAALALAGCASMQSTSGNGADTPANTNSTVHTSASASLPEFPWPPDASAVMTLPSALLATPGAEVKLGDVDARLGAALQKAGYEQRGYYHVPGGFVVVTQMEQFDAATGAPLAGANRWSTKVVPPALFSKEYFRGLISGNAGHFRVLAFAVTKESFNREGKEISAAEGFHLVDKAADRLPNEVKEEPYTGDYQCTALVYEFVHPNSGQAQFVRSSGLLPSQHLQKILHALEGHQ